MLSLLKATPHVRGGVAKCDRKGVYVSLFTKKWAVRGWRESVKWKTLSENIMNKYFLRKVMSWFLVKCYELYYWKVTSFKYKIYERHKNIMNIYELALSAYTGHFKVCVS